MGAALLHFTFLNHPAPAWFAATIAVLGRDSLPTLDSSRSSRKYVHLLSFCAARPVAALPTLKLVLRSSASASTSASIAASNFFDDIAPFQMSRRHYGKGGAGLPT